MAIRVAFVIKNDRVRAAFRLLSVVRSEPGAVSCARQSRTAPACLGKMGRPLAVTYSWLRDGVLALLVGANDAPA